MAPFQPEFDLFAEPEAGRASLQPDRSSLQGPEPPTGQGAYRQLLVEQIVRDAQVLNEDDWCHVPSTEFFVDRIVAYRKEIAELDARMEQS